MYAFDLIELDGDDLRREPFETLASLVDPNVPLMESLVSDIRAAASSIRKQIEVLEAPTGRDIDAVFASLAQKPIDALLVAPSPFLNNRRVQLVTLVPFAFPSSYRTPARLLHPCHDHKRLKSVGHRCKSLIEVCHDTKMRSNASTMTNSTIPISESMTILANAVVV